MICSNCNTMNADGVKFCGNCGAPLGMAQPQMQQAQPQMQPGYGPQMQPGYAPPAGNNKGGGGLKAALIAVCSLLAVAVVVLALVLTGVIGGDKSGSGKTDVVSSNKTSTRPGRNKSGNSGTGDTGGQTDAVTLYDVTIESHAQTFTLTMADGEETTVFEATYDTLSVPDASPELQRQLDALGDTDARRIRDVLSDQAEYMYEALMEEAAYAVFPWQETTKLIVERADSEIFSVVADGYTYSGGVHGVGGYAGHTYAAENGRELTLDEIVTDHEALAEAIEAEMEEDERLSENVLFYREVYDGGFTEYLLTTYQSESGGLNVSWSLTDEGLHVWFSDYMLGSYAAGRGNVLIPFAEYRSLFRDASLFEHAKGGTGLEDRVTRKETDMKTHDLVAYCREEGIDLTSSAEGAGEGRRDAETFAETDAYFLGTWDCTNDPNSTLVIGPANIQTGGYFLDFFFYRITNATGYANITDNGLSVNQAESGLNAEGTDRFASLRGEIARTQNGFTFTITESEAEYLKPGTVYEYVRGTGDGYGITGAMTGSWECADSADALVRMYTFSEDGTWSGEIADYSGESDHPGFHGTYEISGYEDRMLELRLFDENGEV